MYTNKLKTFAWVAMLACVALSFDAEAQRKRTKRAPDPSQGATVSQTIGKDTEVTITYHRPGVKGRDVWTEQSDNAQIGPLVPRGGDPRPWRAGANEATYISTSTDITVEGQALAAGTYSLFMIPRDDGWTVVFNNKPYQWGSFRYDQAEDALRVDVQAVEAPHQEWLNYGFDDPAAFSATAYLRWEKVKVPFKIEVAAE